MAVEPIPEPPSLLAGPPPASEPSPEPDPAADDDEIDRTVLAPPRRPRSGWTLVLPDGGREPIGGVVVVGRRPAKTAFPGADRSLILKDPEGQVSKSHAVFEVDPEGLWVRDLASTNGVVVVAPGGEEVPVTGDARVRVQPGAEVELGRYVVTAEHTD